MIIQNINNMKPQSLPTKAINKHKLSIKIPCMFAERGSYTTPAASSVLTDINCGSCTAVDLNNLSRIKELFSIRTDVVYEIICPST